jgi:hypothetical protein
MKVWVPKHAWWVAPVLVMVVMAALAAQSGFFRPSRQSEREGRCGGRASGRLLPDDHLLPYRADTDNGQGAHPTTSDVTQPVFVRGLVVHSGRWICMTVIGSWLVTRTRCPGPVS